MGDQSMWLARCLVVRLVAGWLVISVTCSAHLTSLPSVSVPPPRFIRLQSDQDQTGELMNFPAARRSSFPSLSSLTRVLAEADTRRPVTFLAVPRSLYSSSAIRITRLSRVGAFLCTFRRYFEFEGRMAGWMEDAECPLSLLCSTAGRYCICCSTYYPVLLGAVR